MEYATFLRGWGKGNLFLFSNFSDNGLTKTQTEPAQRKRRNILFGLRVGNHRLAFRCRQCSGSRVLPPAGHASPGSTPGSSRRWQPGPPACAWSLPHLVLDVVRRPAGVQDTRDPRLPPPRNGSAPITGRCTCAVVVA